MAHLPYPIILASSSPHRRELMARLRIPFTQASPEVPEARLAGESPEAMVLRLAVNKAAAIAVQHPDAIVIGADEIALCQGEILGKPGTAERAFAQLRTLSGQRVRFLTGVAVLHHKQGIQQQDMVPFEVQMRSLSDAEIYDYIDKEQPLGSAGSFKSEGLGIALTAGYYGDDPSALIGLPLIRLQEMLAQCGCRVLG